MVSLESQNNKLVNAADEENISFDTLDAGPDVLSGDVKSPFGFRPCDGDERRDADAPPDAPFFYSTASRRVDGVIFLEPCLLVQCSARRRHRQVRRPANTGPAASALVLAAAETKRWANGKRACHSHDWCRSLIHHRRRKSRSTRRRTRKSPVSFVQYRLPRPPSMTPATMPPPSPGSFRSFRTSIY